MKLIALTGLHGAGKDTVADALPARKLSWSDAMYREVAEAFGVTVADLQDRRWKEMAQITYALERCTNAEFRDLVATQCCWEFNRLTAPRSPRQILQWWGTEYRRSQSENYWIDKCRDAVLAEPGPIVLSGMRFPNEERMVRQLGGQIWQVVRPGHEPPRTGHASETTGDEFAPDVVLVNAGTLDDLRAKARKEWNT